MDEDATWYGCRPQPRGLCVRWGPTPHLKGGGPHKNNSAYVSCGQTAGWIKMPLVTEVGLGPGEVVLDRDPTPPKSDTASSFLLWPNGWMDEDASWYEGRPRSRPHYVTWRLSSPLKRGTAPPHNFLSMSIVAKRSSISATAEHLSVIASGMTDCCSSCYISISYYFSSRISRIPF